MEQHLPNYTGEKKNYYRKIFIKANAVQNGSIFSAIMQDHSTHFALVYFLYPTADLFDYKKLRKSHDILKDFFCFSSNFFQTAFIIAIIQRL